MFCDCYYTNWKHNDETIWLIFHPKKIHCLYKLKNYSYCKYSLVLTVRLWMDNSCMLLMVQRQLLHVYILLRKHINVIWLYGCMYEDLSGPLEDLLYVLLLNVPLLITKPTRWVDKLSTLAQYSDRYLLPFPKMSHAEEE